MQGAVKPTSIISQEELNAIKAKVLSTSAQEVLEEWLRTHQNVGRGIEGRLTYTP